MYKPLEQETTLTYQDRLADGFSNSDQASAGLGVVREYITTPQQTPTPASATPASPSVESDQVNGIPPGLLVPSLETDDFPGPRNGLSTVTDSQSSQPPVTQPYGAQRRRRRFIDWLRRHRSHRHGPWVPFIRRNWNDVSNAIREVELRGFGSSRGHAADPVLVMDPE